MNHQLNASQRRAVDHAGGPLLVVAGPGTGKTRTLTHRIAHLVRSGRCAPGEILALTFTDRAAEEMRARLASLLDPGDAEGPFIGTFHALGLDIIGSDWGLLGFSAAPVLYDEQDREALLREVIRDARFHSGGDNRRVLARLAIKGPRRGRRTPESDPQLVEVLDLYRQRKKIESAVDFDDLITLPLQLLTDNAERLHSYQDRWRHIFIDEYQDVDAVQIELVKSLAGRCASLMAIGDPDQAIYSFRGADVEHFLSFPRDFPGTTVIHLDENFRSTVTIVTASAELITCNRKRMTDLPRSRPRGGRGLRLEVQTLSSDRAEAIFIARRTAQLVGGLGCYGLEDERGGRGGSPADPLEPVALGDESEGISQQQDREREQEEFSFGDIAVLYRLNALAPRLCEAFEHAGIPYQRVGTERDRTSVAARALLALSRLAALELSRRVEIGDGEVTESGSGIETSWPSAPRRTLKELGVEPDEVVHALSLRLRRAGEGTFEQRPPVTAPLFESSSYLEAAVPGAAALLVEAGRVLAAALPRSATDLKRAAGELADEAARTAPRSLDQLNTLVLSRHEDPFVARCERVTLSTLHASKGLEFPVVFIAGAEEGIIPYIRDDEEDPAAALEEERRLLYVGMTRAKMRLVISSAGRRFLFGEERRPCPSPLLAPVSEDLLDLVEKAAHKPSTRRRGKEAPGQLGLF